METLPHNYKLHIKREVDYNALRVYLHVHMIIPPRNDLSGSYELRIVQSTQRKNYVRLIFWGYKDDSGVLQGIKIADKYVNIGYMIPLRGVYITHTENAEVSNCHRSFHGSNRKHYYKIDVLKKDRPSRLEAIVEFFS